MHTWILSPLWPRIHFTDLSPLLSCSSGEGVLWFSNLRTVRLSADPQRCFESYHGKLISMVQGGCWEEVPHGTTPSPSLWREGELACQGKARLPSGQCAADRFSSWDRRVLKEASYSGGGARTATVMVCLFADALFISRCSNLDLVYILSPPTWLPDCNLVLSKRNNFKAKQGTTERSALPLKKKKKKSAWRALILGEKSTAAERTEPRNQTRTVACLFWNGPFMPFSQISLSGGWGEGMKCKIKNSTCNGAMVGWLELAGVSLSPEEI